MPTTEQQIRELESERRELENEKNIILPEIPKIQERIAILKRIVNARDEGNKISAQKYEPLNPDKVRFFSVGEYRSRLEINERYLEMFLTAVINVDKQIEKINSRVAELSYGPDLMVTRGLRPS